MSSPLQFAMKMSRAADNIRGAPRHIAEQSAQMVKRSVQAQLLVAAPRRRLNVGKNGARVGVRYDMPVPGTAVVQMTGPAHLLERPTKAHRIPRTTVGRGRGRAQRARKKPLYIPGVGFRMYAEHPGTRGKYPWRKGVTAALPLLDRVAGDHYFRAVAKALR